jgi:DNA-binding winged helix-turn-helix (wHTH) protein/tetratricopeptide (TPR) repeat protein
MPTSGHEAYEFAGFVLDASERRLSKGDAIVPLAPKAHDLLVALVRNAGHLVTKQELLDRVWPDAAVEEGILAVHVSGLRKALGAERGCIETVARSGYRFTEAVARLDAGHARFSMRWPIGVLPAHPEVHELVGRGRSHLLAASMFDVPKAVAAFRSAIDIDPTYAAAHAGLALACCAQGELRLVAPPQAYAEARASALRALAMEDASADAQVALATVLFLSDWNWTGTQRSLERALAIDPDHADACLLYGRLLEALGRLEEGLAAKQRALERNPFSALVHIQIALSYWNLRRYDDVIAWSNKALALDPRHLLAREFIASAYWKQGDFDRQMAVSLEHAATFGVPKDVLESLGRIYADGGRTAILQYSIRQASERGGPALQLAVLHGEAGDLDEAFRHLDAAIGQRDPSLVHLAVAPQWDSLRGDPRFATRLGRMGLPTVSC